MSTRIKELFNVDVKVGEEIKLLRKGLENVVSETERLKEGFLLNSLSLLLEEDQSEEDQSEEESKENRKKKLKTIDVAEVEEVLQGTGMKLVDLLKDNEKLYESFLSKISGFLRENYDIRILGISKSSSTKELAKDQAQLTTNSSAKKGEAASPIIDLLARQLSNSDDKPVSELAKALNDVNHSGGGIATLLAYVLLTDPTGFTKMADSFKGDRAEGISKLVDFISQGSNISKEKIDNKVEQGATPKVIINQNQKHALQILSKMILEEDKNAGDSVKISSVLNFENVEGFEQKLDKDFQVDNDLKLVNNDIVTQSMFNLFFKNQSFNVPQNSDQYKHLIDTFIIYSLFLYYISNNITNETSSLNDEDWKFTTGIKQNANFTSRMPTSSSENYPQSILSNQEPYRERLKTLKDYLEKVNTTQQDESLVLGDLSNLLFEDNDILSNKRHKRFKSSNKEIDLRKEWLRIWDI